MQVLCEIWQFYLAITALCIMQLYGYVFVVGFLLYVSKNWVLGDFEGEDVKILSSNPQGHYPA